jgi:hypothetical protein
LFFGYCIGFYPLNFLHSPFPLSQLGYLAYNLFRLVQTVTVWYVASHIVLTPNSEKWIWRVVFVSGLLVSIVAILQVLGVVDYRSFVGHLPPNQAISGPWAMRTYAPIDAALGTLNYNRIYAGQFIACILAAVLISCRLSFSSQALIIVLFSGLLCTQSRTALFTLCLAILYGSFYSQRVRINSLVAGIILLLLSGLVFGLAVIDGPSNYVISSRADSVEESLDGRFERQLEGVSVATESLWTVLFGVGFGNLGYFWLGQGFAPAHGQFATSFAELGLLGLALLLWVYLQLFQSISSNSHHALAVKSILFALLICAFFNDYLLPSPSFGTFLLWLFCLSGLYVKEVS